MIPLRLPRTLRLDASDDFVFRRAAPAGEWAVTGTFLFAADRIDALDTKGRIAFRSGFLGVAGFGWSSLAVVTEATPEDHEQAVTQLADSLVAHLGAPGREVARAAAEEEIAFAQSLCDHPVGTVLALHRTVEDGAIRERFRTLTPRPDMAQAGFRAFEFFEAGDDGEPMVEETVDLVGMAEKRP